MQKLTRQFVTEALELAARRKDLVEHTASMSPETVTAHIAGGALALLAQIEGKLQSILQFEEGSQSSSPAVRRPDGIRACLRGWQDDADLGTFDGAEDARKDGKRREHLERYPHVYRTTYEKAFLAELAKEGGQA